MGLLRFELRLPAPQAGRMAKLPYRPKAKTCISVSIEKLILVFLERFNRILNMRNNSYGFNHS